MSQPPKWHNYGLRNPLKRRMTTKIARRDWDEHASHVQQWRAEKKTASDIVKLLADRNFIVTEHQLNNYMYKQARDVRRILRRSSTRENIRPLDRGVLESGLPPPTSYVYDFMPTAEAYDEMAWSESTDSESDYLSSDAEEFPNSNVVVDPNASHGVVTRLPRSFISPLEIMREHSDIQLPDDFQALNITGSQLATPFTSTDAREETLLSSPRVSPTPSSRSTIDGQRSSMRSLDVQSGISLPETIRPPSEELSVLSTADSKITTRHDHGGDGFIGASSSEWQKLVRVGRILDVKSTSKTRKQQPETATKNDEGRPSRRVIVVEVIPKLAMAVPVSTYMGHGICGLSDDAMGAHAILYATGSAPIRLPGEPYMSKRPFRASLINQLSVLDPGSRINFGKTKVLDSCDTIRLVGQLDTDGIPYLTSYWRQHLKQYATTPKSSQKITPGDDAGLFERAETQPISLFDGIS